MERDVSSEQPPEELLELYLEELLELEKFRGLDDSARELLIIEKNEAQLNAKHMLNLRIGSLVFFITILGAVIAYRAGTMDTTNIGYVIQLLKNG